MAYVSVAEWRPEQVTEWLKGLDSSIVSYIHWFSNNEVNGQQLLNLSPDELTHLGVYKLGHQELILEAVQHLRNFHYDLDRENLQFLALRLSCAAHSLYSEIRDQAESSSVPTQIMADVANVIHNVKPLVSWLDRPPFAGEIQYADFKSQLLSLSLEMATCAQRDRFAEKPVAKIRTCSSKLAKLADSIIQDVTDPMILQPATLDIATVKKKAGEDLDFFLVPSFHGIHQIGDMKLSSPAHQSGKIQQGDEIVQVNYQTVVGWSRKKVLALFEESPNDLLITLKRRPRHVKMYGQIYMKPYRLPSRKRALPYSRWNDNLPSPRPELLTIPHFDITRTINLPKKMENNQHMSEPSGTSSSSDEEFGQPSDSQSPASIRLYLPKPRVPIQRRFTLSGPPRPSAQSEQFWRELQLERSWRSNQNNSQVNNSSVQNMGSNEADIDEMFQLRDKSASLGNSIATASSRSTTCNSFSNVRIGIVKFDLTKFDSLKNDLAISEKHKDVSQTTKLTPDEDNNIKNRDSIEVDSNKVSDLGIQGNLTITELNKLKRNAFFNNMDCENSLSEIINKPESEGSSEKVKRVIENFKMEINKTKKDMSEINLLKSPGKVMELIENFEKVKSKECDSSEKCKSYKKERNRLDKSCSTPAYDTTENDSAERNNGNVAGCQTVSILPSKITSEKPILIEKNRHEFKTSAVELNLDYKEDSQKLKNCERFNVGEKTCPEKCVKNKENVFIQNESESEQHNFSYELDPVNLTNENMKNISHTVPSGEEDKLQSDSKDSSGSILSQGSGKALPHKSEIVKPVPAQRKSKLQSQSNPSISPPCPLPPKPRSKPSPLTPEEAQFNRSPNVRLPPEPPPRPDSTFTKSAAKKIGGIDVGDSEENSSLRDSPSGVESNVRNKIISSPIAMSPELQGNLCDLKPSSGAPSPSARKISKPFNNNHPSGPSVSAEKEKPKSSGTLESLKAMLTLGRKSGNPNSPRSLRKKNAILAKKRNVGVKEITSFENSGFLWYRNRKGIAATSWTRYYFILQGSNFYGFKSKESHKADLFIHLPGFTCTLAEEVKSKEFSFKIYHTGTVFYFAANSKEDLQQWLDSVNLGISFQDDKFLPEVVTYSQTDSDSSDTDPEPETCFPTSPKMKKVLGSSPLPKPARSHQNLASESKKAHETQKRFGSLKKLSSQKYSRSNAFSSAKTESPEIASLDRKYLKFLGKSSPTPVPTSRFRSYRRLQPPVLPSKGKPKGKLKILTSHSETQNPPANNQDSFNLMRKPLHSSNPSLIHPDMADYRITQERLAEFRRLRNQSATSDSNRFRNFDHFLQKRHDENFKFIRNRPQELSGLMTLEQFLLCQEDERQRFNRSREGQIGANEFLDREPITHEENRFKSNVQNKLKEARLYKNISLFVEGQKKELCSSKRQEHGQRRETVEPYGTCLDKPRIHMVPSRSSDQGIQCQNVSSHPIKLEMEKSKMTQRSKSATVSTAKSGIAICQPSSSLHSPSTSNQNDDSMVVTIDQNSSKSQYGENHITKKPECSYHNKNISSENRSIEHTSGYEPEMHNVQQVLKNRQKRDLKTNN